MFLSAEAADAAGGAAVSVSQDRCRNGAGARLRSGSIRTNMPCRYSSQIENAFGESRSVVSKRFGWDKYAVSLFVANRKRIRRVAGAWSRSDSIETNVRIITRICKPDAREAGRPERNAGAGSAAEGLFFGKCGRRRWCGRAESVHVRTPVHVRTLPDGGPAGRIRGKAGRTIGERRGR